MTTKQRTTLDQQQGAALVVCLVVLLVITLIAAAGINSASMQQKMAANAQQQNETFQAAEGAVAMAVDAINGDAGTAGDPAVLNTALLAGKTPTAPHKVTNNSLSVTGGIDVYAEFTYLSAMTTSVGNSLDADENSTIIPGHRFIIRGQADRTSSGASSQVELGIEYD